MALMVLPMMIVGNELLMLSGLAMARCAPPGKCNVWEAASNCSPTELLYAGPRLRVDRPTRAAIFGSLCEAAWGIVEIMKTLNHNCFAAAWRFAAPSWLRGQALITVYTASQNQATNDQKNQLRLPLFCEKWTQ